MSANHKRKLNLKDFSCLLPAHTNSIDFTITRAMSGRKQFMDSTINVKGKTTIKVSPKFTELSSKHENSVISGILGFLLALKY